MGGQGRRLSVPGPLLSAARCCSPPAGEEGAVRREGLCQHLSVPLLSAKAPGHLCHLGVQDVDGCESEQMACLVSLNLVGDVCEKQ